MARNLEIGSLLLAHSAKPGGHTWIPHAYALLYAPRNVGVHTNFDPWVLPLRTLTLELSLSSSEVSNRLQQLIAKPEAPTTELHPFRGAVDDGRVALTVRIPTSGVASGVMRHERALVVVHGHVEDREGGCTLKLTLRQPLPAFAILALIWVYFIYSLMHGASPALLFTPLLGHAVLLFFFRIAARQRVLDPVGKALGIAL